MFQVQPWFLCVWEWTQRKTRLKWFVALPVEPVQVQGEWTREKWLPWTASGELGSGCKATYFPGSIWTHTVPPFKNEFFFWENLPMRNLLSSHWSEEGAELGGVTQLELLMSVSSCVCQPWEASLWNWVTPKCLRKLSSQLPGAAVLEREVERTSGFPIFGTSGLKEMKASSLRTF